MSYAKNITKKIALILILIFAICLPCSMQVYADEDELYLGGFAAGFELNTTTVEVVGLSEVVTKDGVICPARQAGIMAGDIISSVNNIKITSVAQLNSEVNKNYSQFLLSVLREEITVYLNITPVIESSTGQKKLGLLVKDSVNGIGTVTYINKSDNTFGSLGHPVLDNNNKLIEINGGHLFGCLIYDVKKGVRGTPGELRGAFENYNIIGVATKNSATGIYGNISSDLDVSNLTKIKKGTIQDVKMGKAEIYCTLKGNDVERYEISIVKVDAQNKDNRNFVIKIDDKDLIEKTGGIVQGMSGSPIVQSGKLIGAITHVFVNDPTRGYGIAIDNMLSS
jgi:stage IV sporulation protein B